MVLHSLICALMLSVALVIPFFMAKQKIPFLLWIFTGFVSAFIAMMVLWMVRREGVRVLHFVTLVPTVLAVAFLLRPAAATIDNSQSARPISQRLTALGAATVHRGL